MDNNQTSCIKIFEEERAFVYNHSLKEKNFTKNFTKKFTYIVQGYYLCSFGALIIFHKIGDGRYGEYEDIFNKFTAKSQPYPSLSLGQAARFCIKSADELFAEFNDYLNPKPETTKMGGQSPYRSLPSGSKLL